jgi:outer membrane protein OmpA-like peptidoglycan-associated protein
METVLEPSAAAALEAADDPASPADGDASGEAVARPGAPASASSLVPEAIASEPDSPQPSDEADRSDVGDGSTAADASRIALQGEVLFGWNSTEVDPRFDGLLDQVAERLSGTDGAIAEIVGYSDPYGQVDYNQMLSLRRAEAVASALVDRGVVADRLTVEGRGPRAPVEETGEPADVALARMVEITVRAN